MKRLTVKWKDGTNEVCVLEYYEGATSVVRCSPKIEPDLDRCIKNGLSEFVGEPGKRKPRTTKPDDPLLIDRIAERLRGYGFDVELIEENE